jgi:lysozyme
MRTSIVGINLIKQFESLHDGDLSLIGLQPKMCPAEIWSEGWGHAMIDPLTGKFLKGKENRERAFELATIKTEAEADKALMVDLIKFERIVNTRIKIPLTQNQFDALVSHTYNTGGSDTLFRLVNERAEPDKIRQWFETRYIIADGRVLPGLVKRRKAEAGVYFG